MASEIGTEDAIRRGLRIAPVSDVWKDDQRQERPYVTGSSLRRRDSHFLVQCDSEAEIERHLLARIRWLREAGLLGQIYDDIAQKAQLLLIDPGAASRNEHR